MRPIPPFDNQVALVTGATSGIGRAYCERRARAGASVITLARREDRLVELCDQLERRYGTRVLPIVCDLSTPHASEMLRAQVHESDLEVDILVNNAGYGVPE